MYIYKSPFVKLNYHLDEIEPFWRSMILEVNENMKALCKDFYHQKNKIRDHRIKKAAEMLHLTPKQRRYLAWISRIGLRVVPRVISAKPELKRYLKDDNTFYILQFVCHEKGVRRSALNSPRSTQHDISRILATKKIGITDDEIPLIEVAVEQVNVYNQAMKAAIDAYRNHLLLKTYFDKVF